MNPIQYRNWDVYAFFWVVGLGMLYILIKICKGCKRCVCGGKKVKVE